MDSFSMMTESAIGDISVLTSLISLLAVAKAIGDDPKEFINAGNSSKRAVMFSFFHGVIFFILFLEKFFFAFLLSKIFFFFSYVS